MPDFGRDPAFAASPSSPATRSRPSGHQSGVGAPEDKAVLALCEQWGFGAVMSSAARQWKQRDPVGAKTVGPCVGSDAVWLKTYRKWIAQGADQNDAAYRADKAGARL